MGSHPTCRPQAVPRDCGRTRRAGFSFVELLFAVMILGIGFIMAAAMFPVAIQQARSSSDETVSAAVAWNAFNLIQETLGDEELAPMGFHDNPGYVRSFRDPQAPGTPGLPISSDPDDPKNQINGGSRFGSKRATGIPGDRLWQRVNANMIVADDPRFAWVAFYQRGTSTTYGTWRNHALIIVIVARAADGSTFRRADVAGPVPLSLQPRPVTFDMTSDGDKPALDQVVVFTGGDKSAVAEGAFLVVANDTTGGGVDLWPQGYENGRVYRIGNRIEGDKWELSPESTYVPRFWGPGIPLEISQGFTKAGGFVVGRPTGPGGFQGPVQDLAVYSMIIPCRPQVQSP